MKLLESIGKKDKAINYIERSTVKVVITKDDSVLILNNGLLPGGGVDNGETNEQAITRELLEELGATISDIRAIGQVTQYRNFLGKQYKIYGYTAQFESFTALASPQDAGEAAFVYKWIPKDDALRYVAKSIATLENASSKITDDNAQGALYNRMTTLVLLKAIK